MTSRQARAACTCSENLQEIDNLEILTLEFWGQQPAYFLPALSVVLSQRDRETIKYSLWLHAKHISPGLNKS
jgi:hypothetical protein